MSKSLIILGRQPALGLAELESLYGSKTITTLGSYGALLDLDHERIDFNRLGGSIKLSRVITELKTTTWREIEKHLIDAAPNHAEHLQPGKLKLGLSVYGFSIAPREVQGTALKLKKSLVRSGRSTRVVPNNETALSSAQVKHNQLLGELGWELLIVKDGSGTCLAQTVAIQDIDAYAARDQARPKRDAKVGMLPPKLAQIIINLANPPADGTVLDPFCGTGVVLQEALLAGFKAYGTDIEPRMIEYSRDNLKWLGLDESKVKLEVADSVDHKWEDFSSVAAETYLGQPYATLPPMDQLTKNLSYVNDLHKKFLENLSKQTKSGFRACLAVPAWKTSGGFKHLPILDHLTDMGYNRLSFVHANNDDLIYHREDQIVARELVVITRI